MNEIFSFIYFRLLKGYKITLNIKVGILPNYFKLIDKTILLSLNYQPFKIKHTGGIPEKL